MKYYKLNEHIVRTHLASWVYYRTDDDNSCHVAVAIGKNTVKPWAVIEEFDVPLDVSDCTIITKSHFNERYEYAIDLNTY